MKEYFSHDYSARRDPKLISLRLKLGYEGVGIYWSLIEYLYEQNGNLLLSQCECIADELHCQCDLLKTIINEFELFKNDNNKFWSESATKRLNMREEKSKKASNSAKIRWSNANAMRTQCDSNAIKEKKRKEKEIKEKNIIPPKIELVLKYCQERKNRIDAQSFMNHYDSNGWMIGKSKMKDWQAAVRTWEKNDKSNKSDDCEQYSKLPDYRRKKIDNEYHEKRRIPILKMDEL